MFVFFPFIRLIISTKDHCLDHCFARSISFTHIYTETFNFQSTNNNKKQIFPFILLVTRANVPLARHFVYALTETKVYINMMPYHHDHRPTTTITSIFALPLANTLAATWSPVNITPPTPLAWYRPLELHTHCLCIMLVNNPLDLHLLTWVGVLYVCGGQQACEIIVLQPCKFAGSVPKPSFILSAHTHLVDNRFTLLLPTLI